ncbi:SAM-dependent DNA methyltransferase [Pseudomonas fluorescens]|uniref:SAM-dependent DNA methyltransferase n=1 Tax=Pseudomonas fluorescens TaxID=294 RepID=UPI001131062F|nr:SAM-dependent DNA methyltransferase [Pseudomonas fluorescens]TMU78782.1 SAM-dependent DNA methyltransferase [Pseudomonas fluorescens]
MNKFNPHNVTLTSFFDSIIDSYDQDLLREMINLDTADSVLRKFLSIDEMRQFGSFFTGQRLTGLAIDGFRHPITLGSVVLDPTCGTGNLLIGCSRKLPVCHFLSDTLVSWGKVLRGFDIHSAFVEATKLRLILEAVNRGVVKDCSLDQALLCFSGIKVADALSVEDEELSDVTHLLMNPPFSNWDSPASEYWKAGKVNAAGVIFDHYIRRLPSGCLISAILPDVLRAGSRYEGWRRFVSEKISGDIQIAGRFNEKTDVDVFLVAGVLKEATSEAIVWYDYAESALYVADLFDVCIGPLVAYRDPQEGTLSPYIHAKNTPVWGTIREFDEFRRFKGRLIKPPFVVIRRTSSPTDKNRASGAIVLGDTPVAVENHLIVLKPKNSKVSHCKKLINTLKDSKTNAFINGRIRCRHLTVGVVREIPIW